MYYVNASPNKATLFRVALFLVYGKVNLVKGWHIRSRLLIILSEFRSDILAAPKHHRLGPLGQQPRARKQA